MKNYLDLIKDVLETGVASDDRTGTGTISKFGTQTRYNLEDGFPAITTKKLAWKGVISELLWFITGSSNERELCNILHNTKDSSKRTVWTDNANKQAADLGFPAGELGPVYGQHWRYVYNPACFPVKTKHSIYTGVYGMQCTSNIDNNTNNELHIHWWKMVNSGCVFADKWKSYTEFEKDASSLPGYKWFLMNKAITLYSDYYGKNIYAPDTTIWVLNEHVNEYSQSNPTYVTNDDFPTRYYPSTYALDKESPNGIVHQYNNKNYVIRHQFPVDQIDNLISQIKTDPNSRRLMLTSLEVGSLDKATLPPCHVLIQFYIRNNKISAHLYQRSCDIGLGCPFNIASYALMIHMIAHITGYGVGEFIHSIGDAHIYNNHIDELKLQLTREPLELPTLNIKRNITNIDDFTMDDFELLNYKHHAPIAMKMAV